MIPRPHTADGADSEPWVRGAGAAVPRAAMYRRLAITSVALSAGYYLGARVGFAFTLHPHPISILWPPNAVLLAAMLLTPPRFWWVLVAAAFPAHLAVELESGVPPEMVVGWFVSNCSEAVIGALCIRRFAPGRLHFDSFRDVSVFLGAAVVAAVTSSFLDAGIVRVIGRSHDSYWRLWRFRSFSNILAEVALVPVIVTWAAGGYAWMRAERRSQRLELALMLIGLLCVGALVFDGTEAGPRTTPALLYLPLPFLLWAAVRLGPLGATTSFLTVVLLAISGAVAGQGPFVSRSPEENARSVQLFLITVGVPMLLLAAIVEERRKAREALQLSEERWTKVFRASPDAMMISRLGDGVVLDVNDRWEALFGRRRDDAVGRTTAELRLYVDDDDRLTVLRVIETHGSVRDVPVDVCDRTGEARNALLTADTADLSGERCVITLVRDVTEQRRAEREAHEQREQLTHLSRVAMLGELSGALAHEINQPLAAILTNAQAAQRFLGSGEFDTDELRDILRDIADDDRRAGEVIRRLRALLKKDDSRFETLDVETLVGDVLDLAHGDLVERNVAARTRFAADLPPVCGDRIQLQQVLLNLVINACDAMSASGAPAPALTVDAERADGGQVRLSISDCGARSLPDETEKLFEPFFTTKRHGLGLGLSISRWIIQAHGGRIWATANADVGATFHVLLPIATAELSASATSPRR